MTAIAVVSQPLTLVEAARAVREREIGCLELVDALLERIERLEPRLNSYITVCAESARQEARVLDKRLARGDHAGPLHGIPISLKDNIATAGTRTTAGSQLFGNRVPSRDATVVRRLREAGAVVIAKANLHELACGADDAGFGDVANPIDTTCSCSGSSSGSAASVKAGLCFASIGTDTGGSIRVPAALCGVVGVKPTYGLVSREAVVPVSTTLDHVGPIARTVDDASIVLRAITERPVAAQPSVEIEGLRIAVLDEDDFGVIDSRVATVVKQAYEALERRVTHLAVTRVPRLAEARTPMWLIARIEAADYHYAALTESPDRFGPVVRERLCAGFELAGIDYVRAQRLRQQIRTEVAEALDDFDAIVLPATATSTFPRGARSVAFDGRPAEDIPSAMGRYTPIFNLTGQPAVVVPCGFTTVGHPVAVQVASRPYEDEVALRVARLVEEAANGASNSMVHAQIDTGELGSNNLDAATSKRRKEA